MGVASLPGLGAEEPLGQLEDLLDQEVDAAALHLGRDGDVAVDPVAGDDLVEVETADVGLYVVGIGQPLEEDRHQEASGFVLQLALLVGPLLDVGDDPPQVGQPVAAGAHGVIAQILRLCPGVDTLARLLAVAVDGIVLVFAQPAIQRRQLLVGILDVEPAVAPADGVEVVGSDLGGELRNAVPGLCDIVEAGVVHDRAGRAVAVGVVLRAQRVDRYGVRGGEVVLQSEAVAQLVRRDEAHGVAHQLCGQDVGAGRRIDGAGLQPDPRVEDAHHVVPPDDVGLDDLAAEGIDDRRAHGVGQLRGGVGDHRVADVVDVEVGLVVGSDLAGDDRLLEPGGLEGLLPLLDSLFDVGDPDGRRRGVDPQHDGFGRHDEFTAQVAFAVFGAGLQPPAVDQPALFGLLLRVVEVEVADLEIPDAIVGETRTHRFPVEQHEVRGDLDRQGCCAALLARKAPREERLDEDVAREGLHLPDLREAGVDASRAEFAEEVVEALFAAVEDLVDANDGRG